MLLRTLSLVLQFLPTRKRVLSGLLALESLIAGALEALVLVLAVQAGVGVAEAKSAVAVELPLLAANTFSLGHLVLGALCCALAVLVLHVHAALLTADIAATVLLRTRQAALNAFANATWDEQSKQRQGSLQETATTLAFHGSMLTTQLGLLAAAALGLSALLAMALVVNPFVTVAAIVLGALVFAALRPLAKATNRRSKQFFRLNSQFAEEVAEWSSIALEARAFGVVEPVRSKLSAFNQAASEAIRRMRRVSKAGAVLYRDLALLLLLTAIGVVSSLDSVEIASAGAALLLVIRALSYGQQLNQALQQISELGPSLEALRDRSDTLHSARQSFGNQSAPTSHSLRLQEVTYAYASTPVLADVSFSISPGEIVGIFGPSGGGKTTLIQLILRLRTPTGGAIFIDNVDYREIDDDAWHHLIALVPQQPSLVEGTISDNIRFHRTFIGEEDIGEAVKAAGLQNEIASLPDGLQTKLGPAGTGLSGGQQQRVTIARALAGSPSILVLDEPTSALDQISEEGIGRTIDSLRNLESVSIIIVSHRVRPLRSCDRVVSMRDGRVQNVGTLNDALTKANEPPPPS